MKRQFVFGMAALFLCWTAMVGYSAPRAHAAGDRKEDKLNGDSQDQRKDRLSGGDSSEASDSSSTSNDGSSSTDNSPSGAASAAKANVASVGGHWSGAVSDNSLGAGTMDLVLAQSGKKLAGGFDTSFASGTEDHAGSVKGKANPSGLNAKLHQNGSGTCRISITGTLASSTEIKGSYNSAGCQSISKGIFDLILEHS
jgi:hypothetical protein